MQNAKLNLYNLISYNHFKDIDLSRILF